MIGQAMPLVGFMANPMAQLIIPVYQRNYDWKVENCKQLYSDLVKLKKSGRANHFFGSLVSASAGTGNDRLIIDGQQRLTTTSLLMLAAIKAVQKGVIECSNQMLVQQTLDTFLSATYCNNSSYKKKLLPIERDRMAYIELFGDDETKYVSDSKLTRNFRLFCQMLEEKEFTFDELHAAINKLQIIHIDLQDGDDPQLIFESINSTGLALEEADKIRNYLLMSLSAIEQEQYYKEYWQKIEDATNSKPTMFLRDYITITENLKKPVNMKLLYLEWKKYMEEQNRDRKDELKNMRLYARYYKQIEQGEIVVIENGMDKVNDKLSVKMKHLNNLQTDAINVFLVQFLKYAEDNNLAVARIYDVLDLVENYMARRIVCGLPSNALTQVFCALHGDVIKSIKEYEDAGQPLNFGYVDILKYHLLRRDGNYALPNDAQFKEGIETRDAYHMLKPFQIFLFERLENLKDGEINDVATEMRNSDATIEHVMPQTLSKEWKEMLGDDAERVHEEYLHRFANLTLTGVNSELSNNPFEEKKKGKVINGQVINGYLSSKYRLTEFIKKKDKWTEIELKERAKDIESKFMTLYPFPSTAFQPLPKPTDEVTLDDDFSPVGRKLIGYTLYGRYVKTNVWVELYKDVVRTLYDRFQDDLSELIDKQCLYSIGKVNSLYADKMDSFYKLDENVLLCTTISNNTKLTALRYMFDKAEQSPSELVFSLEPIKP